MVGAALQAAMAHKATKKIDTKRIFYVPVMVESKELTKVAIKLI